jgi:hypothetical protein
MVLVKGLVVALLWLLPVAASAVPVGGHRWPTTVIGPGQLPSSSAIVQENCDNPPFRPCFETIQAAIDHVETEAPDSGREVFVAHKDSGAAWDENINCDLNTGFTNLVGSGYKTGETGATAGAIQHSGPKLTATSGVIVTMASCGLKGFWVNHTDDLNPAIEVTGPEGMYLFDTLVNNNDVTAGFGDGNSLIEFTAADATPKGHWVIEHSTVVGTCGGGAGADGCDADSQVILVDSTSTGSDARLLIANAVVSLQQGTAVAGAATIKIVDGPRVDVENSRVICENGMTCFEVDDANVELNTFDLSSFGGLTTPAQQGRYIDVIGTGTGSILRLGAVDNADAFTLPSRWGSVTSTSITTTNPQYIMGCQNPHSIEFDPIDTGISYVEIGDANDAAGHAPAAGASAAAVGLDNFIVAGATVLHNLTVEVDVAVANAGIWFIQIEDDGVLTSHLCTIRAFSGGLVCETSATFGIPDAEAFAAGSRINLRINAVGTPTPAAEMIVSFCLSAFPQ